MMDIISEIKQRKIVPVVVFNNINEVLPKMKSLVDGGLDIAEITFRTECADAAIDLAARTYPNAIIGAGTIINKAQCERAIKVGAKFIVSPGYSKEVLAVCQKYDIPYIPGVVTPSEIMEAINDGLTYLKFFPCSDFGGLKTIKALSSVFPNVRFMPTGGIDLNTMLDYLKFDKIYAIGGSFMMKGSEEEIYQKTKAAVEKLGEL